MAYTTINKSTDYFNTKLYNGNGSAGNAVTGVGFAPDFVWIKERSASSSHVFGTTVQGVNKRLQSDNNTAEGTLSNLLTSFDSDGFTNGADNGVNESGQTYASWNWKAGTAISGATVGLGTLKTYTGSVNTTSGFSIIKYIGNGTAGHQFPHGLGVTPKMIIVKNLGVTENWFIYHVGLSSPAYTINLNRSASQFSSSSTWNSSAPNSTSMPLGTDAGTNGNNNNYLAYCFAEKTGYSKFGSYTGNGNADGTFIYTGFKPAFVMFKRTDGGTQNWALLDSTRSYANVANHTLAANSANAESSFGGGESVFGASNKVDILSNGIKIREASAYNNSNGNTFIYMAFAEAPLVGTNNVPANAR